MKLRWPDLEEFLAVFYSLILAAIGFTVLLDIALFLYFVLGWKPR